MLNPSLENTYHFEGVSDDCTTVEQALAWRDSEQEYIKPIQLTQEIKKWIYESIREESKNVVKQAYGKFNIEEFIKNDIKNILKAVLDEETK